jgi:hypothetical protein
MLVFVIRIAVGLILEVLHVTIEYFHCIFVVSYLANTTPRIVA